MIKRLLTIFEQQVSYFLDLSRIMVEYGYIKLEEEYIDYINENVYNVFNLYYDIRT